MTSPTPLPEFSGVDLEAFRAGIVPSFAPVVLRGLVADWPAVQAASGGAEAAWTYLAPFDRGAPAVTFVGPSAIRGRYFYSPDMRGFNFERRTGRFGEVVRHILDLGDSAQAPSVYIGSVPTAEVLPGFDAANGMPLLPPPLAVPRIWIGNRSEVSAHFDLSDNIACVVAGRRRFTLFPPDQLPNLYVGPLDHTMAGQPASMVAVKEPDFERHPRFREALAAAFSAELEPGDAIYIPSLWWHHVEALSPFNILVNYWWDDAPADSGSLFEALVHAIYGAGTVAPERLAAWRGLFDHYVFRANGEPAAHLDPAHRGILSETTPALRQRLRQFLLRGLSR